LNWVTVIASAVNFLVLVVLLKVFLYDRIVTAMDERRKRMAEEEAATRKAREDAEQAAGSHRRAQEELENRREEMMREAREEADGEREALVDQAREEVTELSRQWKEAARSREKELTERLRVQAADGVGRIATKALADLADASLSERMIETFLRRLDEVDGEEWTAFDQAVAEAGDRVSLNVAPASPDDEAIGRLTEAIRKRLGRDVAFSVQPSDDLVCGVSVHAHGRALGWSIAEYLDAFTEGLRETLQRHTEMPDAAMEEPPGAGGEPEQGDGSSETDERSDERASAESDSAAGKE